MQNATTTPAPQQVNNNDTTLDARLNWFGPRLERWERLDELTGLYGEEAAREQLTYQELCYMRGY